MMILLSKNPDLIKKSQEEIENLVIVEDTLNCQLLFNSNEIECDILILDWNLVQNMIDGFILWIIKKELFIKYIIFYTEDMNNVEKCTKIISKLHNAKYKANIISLKLLMEGLTKL